MFEESVEVSGALKIIDIIIQISLSIFSIIGRCAVHYYFGVDENYSSKIIYYLFQLRMIILFIIFVMVITFTEISK